MERKFLLLFCLLVLIYLAEMIFRQVSDLKFAHLIQCWFGWWHFHFVLWRTYISGKMNWESFNHYYKTRPLQTNPWQSRGCKSHSPVHSPVSPFSSHLPSQAHCSLNRLCLSNAWSADLGLPLVQPLNNQEEILTDYTFVWMRSKKILTSLSSRL